MVSNFSGVLLCVFAALDSDIFLYRGIFVSLIETEVSLSFFINFKNIYVLCQEERKHQSRYSSSFYLRSIKSSEVDDANARILAAL